MDTNWITGVLIKRGNLDTGTDMNRGRTVETHRRSWQADFVPEWFVFNQGIPPNTWSYETDRPFLTTLRGNQPHQNFDGRLISSLNCETDNLGCLRPPEFFGLFFFFFFRAAPTACGGSQARGSNQSYICRPMPEPHSSARSEPRLQPTPQLPATLDPQPTERGQGSNPQPHGS